MTTQPIACVGFPAAIPGIYDYAIPAELVGKIAAGTPVLVPVRNRLVWGVIIALKDHSTVAPEKLKPLAEAKKGSFTNSGTSIITLYRWIASYYQCEIGKVFKPFVRKKMLDTGEKTLFVYRLTGALPAKKLTAKEEVALAKLTETDPAYPPTTAECSEKLAITPAILTSLVRKGVLDKISQTFIRDASEMQGIVAEQQVTLTPQQQDIYNRMEEDLFKPEKPYLLHGITGSGKTFIYIELTRKALDAGKGVIILVPEISLTPQTIRRFREALGDIISVMHSRMSDGERRDSVEQVISGKKRLLIGARSAILVPMENIGLIIVDEEHDGSYKQTEMDPRYSGRDVAVVRGKFEKALVVLGSATPSVESYYNALSGKYHLCTLTQRVGKAALPMVTLADMNEEHKANNWTFISRSLKSQIEQTLAAGRQVIVLLNRRGFSVSLICTDCAHTYNCPHCSVKLTYHRDVAQLKCHQCGYFEAAPEKCPKCKGEQIKYKGTGIQKAEELLAKEFPTARILRMDQDSTRRKGAHMSILDAFSSRKADILLGTQMVAKGLDFPSVQLVGVIQADIGLHMPDFRASEKTFQLLAQVAGRAGRSEGGGEVIIQTYVADAPAMLAAREHNYLMFYEKEIEERRALGYPPFSRLVRILVQGKDVTQVKQEIHAIAKKLHTCKAPLTILGPSPAIIERLDSLWRYSILIKAENHKHLADILAEIRQDLRRAPKGVKVMIDVDPVNML